MVAASRFWMASNWAAVGLLSVAEHSFKVSSGMSRGCQSGGAERNAAFTVASTRAGSTAGWSAASAAGATRAARASTIGFIAASSALDRRSGDLAARGLVDEVGDERDAYFGAELELRHAHLPVAVVQPVLHRHDVRGGHAISGPFADHLPGLVRICKMGQPLQADPLAGLGVAGRARENERARTPLEQRLSERDRVLLFGMAQGGGELCAARLAGHPSGDRPKLLDRLPAGGVRPLEEVAAVEALQLFHAPEEPGLEVHHLVGVREIARQLREGALDLARAAAEIAT